MFHQSSIHNSSFLERVVRTAIPLPSWSTSVTTLSTVRSACQVRDWIEEKEKKESQHRCLPGYCFSRPVPLFSQCQCWEIGYSGITFQLHPPSNSLQSEESAIAESLADASTDALAEPFLDKSLLWSIFLRLNGLSA
ncbi:hypothetical protein L2E82_53759 [Cichorium intybus]|nr:hypothetical protein L2E82_53759 [Cichorium intybus]